MERSAERQLNQLEMQWLNHDMGQSPSWYACKNTQRDYVHDRKQFVVWDRVNDQPQICDVLQVCEVGISWDEGIIYLLKSSQSERQYTVGHKPRELIAGIFFWIPGFADTRFAPFQYAEPASARRLTLPVMFRTAHRIPVESARYISSMKDFKEAWPGVFKG
jgi:hypothetical protein